MTAEEADDEAMRQAFAFRQQLVKEGVTRPHRISGIKNIQSHKWYASFGWDAMENMTLDPPYKPVVKSKKDISNFSARKEDMPKQVEYHDDGSGWDKDFAS